MVSKEQIKEWLDKKPRMFFHHTEKHCVGLSDVIHDCIQDLGPKWVSVEDELPESPK